MIGNPIFILLLTRLRDLNFSIRSRMSRDVGTLRHKNVTIVSFRCVLHVFFRHASVSCTYLCQSVSRSYLWDCGKAFITKEKLKTHKRTHHVSLDRHRASVETCDLSDMWSQWWGEMSQGCMEAWMLLGLGCMEAAILKNVWWQQCSAKKYTDGQSGMRTEIRRCTKA